ncbi:hypothetical protein P1P75_05620 [Streptomyces sp. ID05-39B]|uniref:hypothetical protein n=1 Tax=Streptomyces sp. ID05-39B TaxID=3028664 RepID=UPI0029B707D4|nr:hypothetical protein [Streptomyces sp. ID05-39B]MDX3525925.1 hypothetical protein [Streptomyces sp. ID05-39B]
MMIVLVGCRCDSLGCLTRWCRLMLNGVGMSGGLGCAAPAGVTRVGEEMHQAEGEEQQEHQTPHRASPCPGPVAHSLRHLAVAST